MIDISDRPLFQIIQINSDLYATCGASHSIYTFDTKVLQDLYTKEFGHTDWVVGIVFLGDLYSAGMDGHLCRWTKCGNRFKPTKAVLFQGPISKISTHKENEIWAGSYDGTLCCYDKNLNLKLKFEAKSPIVDFSIDSDVYYCDKGGILYQCNLLTKKMDQIQAHHGPFSLYALENVWTVGKDGFVRCFDFSLAKAKGRRLANIQLSPIMCSCNQENIIAVVHSNGISILDTLSKRVTSAVVDGKEELARTAYTCHLKADFCYIGWGNGTLSVLDTKSMKMKRHDVGLKNAIRSIIVTDRLMLVGDDGKVVSMDINQLL